MKRKIKIDNLIEQDTLAIYGRDWVSFAMDRDKYENGLALIVIDNPTDFEIEIEVDKVDTNIMIRVRQLFFIPVQIMVELKKYTTIIKLIRTADPIY